MSLATADSVRQPQPDLPLSMPPYRIEAFRRCVAARLREGVSLSVLQREQQALQTALADPAFAAAMTQNFIAEMKKQEPNTAYTPDESQVAAQMQGILNNRTADAKGFITLLHDTAFIDSVHKLAVAPARPEKKYELPAVKKEEVVRRLVGEQDPDGAEPLIHVASTALGHQLVHQALADIFRPKTGPLREPLQQALKRAWPDAAAEQTQAIAASWLKARHDAAEATADGMKPGGELYVAAMQRSEQARQLAALAGAGSASPKSNARLSEAQKTRDERAEDIAYTINHALSCLTTDVFVAPLIQGLFGFNLGCSHADHVKGHGDHAGHSHPVETQAKGKLNSGTFLHAAGHYFQSEVIGDFAAVPATIAVQRFAPGLMQAIGRHIEPIASPLFHHGAQNAAVRWGKRHGLEATNQEVVDRAEMIYRHEMQHLPQAVMWNVFSFPAGVLGQYMLEQHHWKDAFRQPLNVKQLVTIAGIKTVGTAVSNGMLLGWRAHAPDTAEKFDRLDSKYVIRPTTRVLGKLFGVNDADVKRMEEKEKILDAAPKWAKRVERDKVTLDREQSAVLT